MPGAGGMSRKELDDLTAEAKQAGAKGLVWIKVTAEGVQSPVAKFMTGIQPRLLETLGGVAGDLLLLVADIARGRGHRARTPAGGPRPPVRPDPGRP